MADLAALRTALGRLGFTNAAATAITAADQQDIGDLEELRFLTDTEVENLCKVIRRPGGTINDAAGNPVPNPGIPVTLRAENNLKLAAYFLRHRKRVSRPVVAADITLVNVCTLRDLRNSEESYKAPSEVPSVNDKDWPKTIEAILDILRTTLGEDMIPLAYVVRES